MIQMRSVKKFAICGLYLLNLIIIGGFWYAGSSALFGTGTAGLFLAFGRLYGLLAVLSILTQVTLIGRNPLIEQTFGLDKLTRIHNANGRIAITFILLHPIFITLSYAQTANISFVSQLLEFMQTYPDVWQAVTAVVLFSIIVALSIYIVRKRLKYETWYYVHIFTYAAILLAWGHQLKLGGDFANRTFVLYWYVLYALVFGSLVVFRFIRPIYNLLKYGFVVERVVSETGDTNSVYITGNNIASFKSKPGQFVIVRFLQGTFISQKHPFSLSYIPKDNKLRLTIKASGDYTSTIQNLKSGTKVLIDGPYGVFTPDVITKDKILFIAGGVGITPIRPIVEWVAPNYNVVLLYGSRTQKDIIFKQELDTLSKKYRFPIYYVLSNDPTYAGEKGQLDKDRILRLVSDITDRDVYLCGPAPMIDGVRKSLAQLNVPKSQIHFEKFSL